MTIILYHQHASGQIGCPEIRLNGRIVDARQYDIIEHAVEIDGAEDVIQHDVATLLAMGFTLATPKQQEEYSSRRRDTTTIHEIAGAVEKSLIHKTATRGRQK